MRTTRRPIAWLLSALLAFMPVLPAQAAMIGTDQIVAADSAAYQRDELKQLMNREAARQRLLSLGVSPEWVQQRVDNLSGEELARINQKIENLNAGSDSVLGIILIIFIVFIVTDAIGATDIFPFVHPVK